MNYIMIPGLQPSSRIQRTKENIQTIFDTVCKYFDVTIQGMKSKNRIRGLVEARQSCIYVLRKKTSLSLKEIGVLLNRDHTTVIHSLHAVEDHLQTDDVTKKNIKNLMNLIPSAQTRRSGWSW